MKKKMLRKRDLLYLKKLLLSSIIGLSTVVESLNATNADAAIKQFIISDDEIDVDADLDLNNIVCEAVKSTEKKEVTSAKQLVVKELSKEDNIIAKQLINDYSKIYNLNPDIVYDIISNKTNNFSNHSWSNLNCIDEVEYSSMEEAIIETIIDISRNPNNYSISENTLNQINGVFTGLCRKEEKVSENDISSVSENDIKLTKELIDNGDEYIPELSAEEMVEKYATIFGVNKEVAMSICYAECGTDMGSYNYLAKNNPAGLAGMSFKNKEIGIIYYISLLKNSYGATEISDEIFLERIASKYCEIPQHWLSLTKPIYRNLTTDYRYYTNGLNNSVSQNTLKLKK